MPGMGIGIGVPFGRGTVSGPATRNMLLDAFRHGFTADGLEVIDGSGNGYNLELRESNCLDLDGTTVILVPEIVGTETATNGGTSTVSFSAGQIEFTAGTCWNLEVSNGSHYPMASRSLVDVYDVSTNQYHGTLNGGTPATTTQNVYHYNILFGGSKVVDFPGDGGLTKFISNAYRLSGPSAKVRIKLNVKSVAVRGFLGTPMFYMGWGTGGLANGRYGSKTGNGTRVIAPGVQVWEMYQGIHTVDGIEVNDLSAGSFTGTTEDFWLANLNFSGGRPMNCDIISHEIFESGVLVHSYQSAGHYADVLPDLTGSIDGSIVGGSPKYFPALADGSDDVAGLGLTNPAGSWIANPETKFRMKAANPALLFDPFFSANHSTYDDKGWDDILALISVSSGINQTWAAFRKPGDVCNAINLWAYAENTHLTLGEYNQNVNWKGNDACGAGVIEPEKTFEGFYSRDVDGNLVFPTS